MLIEEWTVDKTQFEAKILPHNLFVRGDGYDERRRIESTHQKKYVKMRDIKLSVLPSVIESLVRSRKVMEIAGKRSG